MESSTSKDEGVVCDGERASTPTIPGVTLMEHEDTALWQNKALHFYKKNIDHELHESLVEAELQEAENDEEGVGFFGGIGDKLQQLKTDLSKPINSPCAENSPDHPRPVGGWGFANVASNPKFPAHPFFEAGRIFRVRLRHSNLCHEDDAAMDGRVTCVKFADEDEGGPLDLILHTGRVPQYQNTDSFHEYLNAVKGGEEAVKDWIFKKPNNYYSRVESLRRGPNSYYDQRYYSHVTYSLEDEKGTTWHARLRLLPADGCEESGLLDDEDQENVWKTARKDGEIRPLDYLRPEYSERRKAAAVQYRLQVQIHEKPENGANQSVSDPWIQWPQITFPWMELAVLTITNDISPAVLANTKYCLSNNQPSFKPLGSKTMKDFSSLSTVLKEFHGTRPGTGDLCKELSEEKETYKVRIVTGKHMNAGTDADVFITITGDNGRTGAIELDTRFHDDFEAGQADEFDVSCSAVGEVVFVDMTISSMLSSRKWFLEEVVVMEAGGNSSRFPCYQWLTHRHPAVTLRCAKPLPPQNELWLFPYLQRKFEIFEKRMQYKWEKMYGLPSRIKASSYEDLPQEAQFQMEKDLDLTQKYLRTLANTGVGGLLTMIGFWDILKDNQKLLTKFLKEKSATRFVMEVWRQDEEFGRQVLNGPHPTRVTRTTHIPSVFSRHTAVIQNLMERGLSIDEEIQAGHLYQLSYPELENLEKCRDYRGKYQRYITAPHCLLYVNAKSKLVPIAIVLDDANLVWTPKDTAEDWLLAKMWVREADAQVHQVVSRHLHTHLFMETVSLATIRNLSSAHPVYKLLLPHLRYTFAVNVLGRQHMYPAEEGLFEKYLAVGGQHEELMKEAYRTFNIQTLNVPRDLATRGVNDREALPDYHYRDDALRLWGVVQKFVRTVLILNYWDNDSVQADEEIQDWIKDLWENGLPVWKESTDKGSRNVRVDKQEPAVATSHNQEDKIQTDNAMYTLDKNDTKSKTVTNASKPEANKASTSKVDPDAYMTQSVLFGKKKMTLKAIAKEHRKNESPTKVEGEMTEMVPEFQYPAPVSSKIIHEEPVKHVEEDTSAPSRPDTSEDQSQVHYHSWGQHFADHGVPKRFDSVSELTDFVTLVIFTASCQHAAVTFGSMDYYGYVPNAPTMMLQPPPKEKGKATMDDIKKALPSKGKTAEIIAACYTLSRLDKDEVFLDQFPEMYFDDPSIQQTIMAYQEELMNVSNEIEERNKGLDIPYTYLLPSKVPKSVSM